MNISIADKARQSFSNASRQYDNFSDIQRKIGLQLIDQISKDSRYGRILDVGMGTGWITEQLLLKFPNAYVGGVDFAKGMADCAREKKINFAIQADAHQLPFKEKTFDLIFSNCAYQWIADLAKAFASSAYVLKDEGDFYFTCFGRNTLQELRLSLRKVGVDLYNKQHNWHFLEEKKIYDFLCESKFQKITMETQAVVCEFSDMFALIRWLKSIGANRIKRDIFVGKTMLNQANDFYKVDFSKGNSVYATFEVIYGKAQK